jgi:hypothetical protein
VEDDGAGMASQVTKGLDKNHQGSCNRPAPSKNGCSSERGHCKGKVRSNNNNLQTNNMSYSNYILGISNFEKIEHIIY